MPANLPPQYFEVEKKFREAKTREEKIKYLKEMIAVMPKHKGTEKLYGILKQKLSKLMREEEKSAKSRKETLYSIPKEEAAQVVLFGLPNSGKSALFNRLTGANALVADYPFSTTKPEVGIMRYENVRIQMVDLPPFSEEHFEGWQKGIAINSDMLLVTVDASSNTLIEDIEETEKLIQLTGLSDHLKIKIFTKVDLEEAKDNIEIARELGIIRNHFIKVSIFEEDSLKHLKKEIFEKLNLIRVYTKPPGKTPDFENPLVLKKESTVLDAAKRLHKDFAKRLLYARLWNKNGIRVSKEHVLEDGDVIEFHLKD